MVVTLICGALGFFLSSCKYIKGACISYGYLLALVYHLPVAIVCGSCGGDGDNEGTIVVTVNVGFAILFSFLKTLLSISQPNIMSKKGTHQSKIDDCTALFI